MPKHYHEEHMVLQLHSYSTKQEIWRRYMNISPKGAWTGRSNKRRVKRFSKWNNIHCLKNEVFHYKFLQQMWPNPQFPTDLVTFTEEILHGKFHFLCSDYYLVSNRLLNCVTPTKKGDQAQLVVPQDTRSMLIQWHHDHTASGHFGLSKTYEKFR